MDEAIDEFIGDLKDPDAADAEPSDPPGTPPYNPDPDEVEDPSAPEPSSEATTGGTTAAARATSSQSPVGIPARRNDRTGSPVKPKFYVYNLGHSKKTLHGYCSKSPNQAMFNSSRVDFRGPCARHDLCIEFKQATNRSYCDDGFKR